MQITRDTAYGNQITAYDSESVTINQQRYSQPVFVSAHSLELLPDSSVISELVPVVKQLITTQHVEILLWGTGNQQLLLPPPILATLYALNIGLEIMSTPAVCRTYGVLLAEERKVAAVLLQNAVKT